MFKIFLACCLLMFNVTFSLADQDMDSHFIGRDYSQRISLDFKDAPLVDVLKIFSKQSGRNFVAATDISSKTVTLFFDNIPLDDALNKLLEANNLMFEESPDSDIFIIKAKPDPSTVLITKVYPLKYASVSSSKINSTISISSGGSSSGSSGGSSGGSSSDSSSGSSSSSSGSSSSSSSSGSSSASIAASLQPALSKAGSVVEDARTNSLIVSDVQDQFPTIEAMLAKLDVPIAQILIEVEMIDVSKGTSDKIGVTYGTTPLKFSGGSRNVLYPFDQNMLIRKGAFDYTGGTGSTEYTAGKIDATGMTAALDFIRSKSDSKNLARPRLLTLNNQTAEIKISTDEAIGLTTSTDNTSSGASTTSVEAERIQTGVFLTVTPQANLDTKEILLAVYPKVIQARDSSVVGPSGQKFKDPEERGTQTILRVKDGETIILGGLIRDSVSTVVTKVPVLGDIPLLGAPFRHKDEVKDQRELIIFITPHIIDDNNRNTLKINPTKKSTTSHQKRLQTMNKALNRLDDGQ